MRLRSIRARLMLWNIVTLTITLLACGGAIAYFNVNRVLHGIDTQLLMVSGRMNRMGLPRERGPMGPPPMPPGQDPEARAAADLQRPRWYLLNGEQYGGFWGDKPLDEKMLSVGYQGRMELSTATYDGQRVRVITGPARQGGRIVGAWQWGHGLRDYDLLVRSQALVLLFFLPIAIIAAALGAWLMTNRALRPVANVTAAASEITHSDLARRLPVEGEDELAQMARTFNEMLERLDLSFQERERAYTELEVAYENHKRFLADASHELRTPLARMQLAATNALNPSSNDNEKVQALEVANKVSGSMGRLVQQLLTLSRADAGQLDLRKASVDLRLVLSDALEEVLLRDEQKLRTSFPDEKIEVLVDPDQMRRVFVNLVENAARHTPSGEIFVSVAIKGTDAVVNIKDTGEGISPEHLPHVFERFYRADAARSDGGTGLGLAICRSIMEAHGGSVEIESVVGQGTTALVRITMARSADTSGTAGDLVPLCSTDELKTGD